MVTNGGPGIHLQKAPKLYKEWGEGQIAMNKVSGGMASSHSPGDRNECHSSDIRIGR